MNGKISITLDDGSQFEGTVTLKKVTPGKSAEIHHVANQASSNHKRSKLALCVDQLESQGYFTDNPVVATPELLKAFRLKCNKVLNKKHATRDLGKLVVEGILHRDEVPPTPRRPNGVQIWFLPNTDKKIIADFKNANSGSN